MKNKEWKPWIDIVEKGPVAIEEVLSLTDSENEILIALVLACAKWHPCRKPHQGLVYYIDKVGDEVSYDGVDTCALCRLFFNDEACARIITPGRTQKCPLREAGHCCLYKGSLFLKWSDGEWITRIGSGVSAGDALFVVLKKLYSDEYRRVVCSS